jgi:deoxyribose-phosphate aldolase
MTKLVYSDIAKMIDHAVLQPSATDEDLAEGCRLAREYDVASVCVKPFAVRQAALLLSNSTIAVGTVIGFPHGGQATEAKVAETEFALRDGAREIDFVVNIGKVIGGDWPYVQAEISGLVETSHRGGAIVKVIFENCYLSDPAKTELCKLCTQAGADFVKTSTGFGSSGAEDADLRLMRGACPPHVQVKAAGGIRTLDRLLEARSLGATRIGTSATKSILDECRARLEGRIEHTHPPSPTNSSY